MTETLASTRNRRIHARRPAKRSTKVTCQKGAMGLGANLALALLDVAETGVRMVLRSSLEVGQEVEVTLLGPGQAKPLRQLAEVAWCVETADNRYCMGACFQGRLTFAELQSLS